ncbi:MAG: FAD-dependent oxidoreductase, partial [Woeseiales bacterium]
AQTNDVSIRHWSTPIGLSVANGLVQVKFERTRLDAAGKLQMTGETWMAEADIVFKAVGQTIDMVSFSGDAQPIKQHRGKLVVDEERKTSLNDVWAGGDCIFGHDDLTVSAVQDGKLAALSIDRHLRGEEANNG